MTTLKKKFPEASTYHALSTAVEDVILREWTNFILESSVLHLSLHYDGVRVSAESLGLIDEFCDECERHIAQTTGFHVKIREKKHEYFMDMLVRLAVAGSDTDVPENMLTEGDCILCSVYNLTGKPETLLQFLQNAKHEFNVYRLTRKVRTYQQVAKISDHTFVPMLGCHTKTVPISLLHFEHDGNPHCVAVRYNLLDASYEITDGNKVYNCSERVFDTCATSSIDCSTLVTFALFPPGATVIWPAEYKPESLNILLSLQAAGKRARAPSHISIADIESTHPQGDLASDEDDDDDGEGPLLTDGDDGEVCVGTDLLGLLEKEVSAAIRSVKNAKTRQLDASCPLCPWRSFPSGGHKSWH